MITAEEHKGTKIRIYITLVANWIDTRLCIILGFQNLTSYAINK